MPVVLCLSGTGYRAALFAAGSLLRLAETGFLQPGLRLQAVSGGAIAAACLASGWARIQADGGSAAAVRREVLGPLRRLAARTLDGRSVVGGLLFPRSGSEWLAHTLDREICHGLQLGDLASDLDLTLGATALDDGSRVAFGSGARPRAARHAIVGGRVRLSEALCASMAWPPAVSALPLHGAQGEPLSLVDGSVADPLALAEAGESALVCDGAGVAAPVEGAGRGDQAGRMSELLLEAARAPAARAFCADLAHGRVAGAYWGLQSRTADYAADTGLVCPPGRALGLSLLPGRFAAVGAEDQERLVNWGYAICDLALRSGPAPALPMPAAFPFRDGGL